MRDDDPSPAFFAFRGQELLLRLDAAGAAALPGEQELLARGAAGLRAFPTGRLEGAECFAVALDDGFSPPESDGLVCLGLRRVFGLVPDAVFQMAGRAFQILEWHRTHRYCGRCGAPTTYSPGDEARRCAACESLYFPRVSPAVIVLVARGDELLLARSPHFQPGVFSAVAGFVEPGETLEQAVAREVREEVGVEVRDIRYFGSQPWPFPHNLMIGFTAEYAGGEVRLDEREIEAAGWFAPDRLPALPTSFSIARALIERFVAERAAHARNAREAAT